ncbi:MAG: SIS domain-containing protein [Alphaproteobacteria bacterium]
MTATADAYLADLAARIARLRTDAADALGRAADAVEAAVRADRLVYVFGTGHSHILAEEVHYRAGGLAVAVPILAAPTMLHEGAVAGTVYERMPGLVKPILDRYPIGTGDVLVVSSNSGVNPVPLEAAQIGRERGATVIAITSETYSRAAAAGRPRLADLAHIVLDNGAPAGDAATPVPASTLKVGPVSTAIGVALINAVFAEVAARLQASGEGAPIYLSANMPGAGEHNARLVDRFRSRNPHL